MRIALAQNNPIIGDFDGNLKRLVDYAEKARRLKADLCVFPELCITGYPPLDLLERPEFIDQNLKALDMLTKQVKGIAVIAGYISRTAKSTGKELQNTAALIRDGQIVSTHIKMLLPTYDVFDERRYFEPAGEVHTVEFEGKKLGISICEDIWNDPDFWPKRLYDRDPIAELINKGADILINISASPFTLEKRTLRPRMLKSAATNYGRPLVFVNQMGGNDDLVFDGHSLAFNHKGDLLARCKEFDEDLAIVDLDSGTGDIRACSAGDEEGALNALILGTKDYVRKCGFKSAVLGLSGGIDSSLTAVIAARALGPENVTGVLMPSRYTSKTSIDDALSLAKTLGIKTQTVPIDSLFTAFLDQLEPVFEGRKPDITEENIQARVRGVILMSLSNKFGHILLTTGNKSEIATGYCTLYGDMAGGFAILSDVPKTLVYRISEEINKSEEIIPESVLTKPPSAELKENQKDEDSLPPYSILDKILELMIEQRLDIDQIAAEGFDRETVAQVAGMVMHSEYKRRQTAPGIKLTSKAFGPGRRMPLAQKWRSW